MYKKVVYYLRAHKLCAVLEVLVSIEMKTRFRIREKLLDSWYNKVGRYSQDVRKEMRLWYGWRADWSKLSINEKRTIFCSVMYY